MSSIRVEIVSAEVAIFSGEASMVVAPGKDGDLGIAPKHTPLLTTLRPGAVSYTHLRAHETRHDLVCRLLLGFWHSVRLPRLTFQNVSLSLPKS